MALRPAPADLSELLLAVDSWLVGVLLDGMVPG